MDIASVTGLERVPGISEVSGAEGVKRASLTGTLTDKEEKANGSLFEAFLNSAIDNIKTTNSYLSKGEDEYLKFAMGETENFHDLTIALQKASTALQYTVAVRDRLLDAYKELMQMQI